DAETSDGEPIGGQGGGDGGGGGDATSSTTSGSGGGDDRAADYAALESCTAAACGPAGIGRFDIGGVNPPSGFDCVLPAVRDRTPGLYRIEQNHQWAGAMVFYRHVVVVTPGGDALWATESEYNISNGSPPSEWEPFTTV